MSNGTRGKSNILPGDTKIVGKEEEEEGEKETHVMIQKFLSLREEREREYKARGYTAEITHIFRHKVEI